MCVYSWSCANHSECANVPTDTSVWRDSVVGLFSLGSVCFVIIYYGCRTASNSGTLGSPAPSVGESVVTTADSEEPVKTDTEPTKSKGSREKPSSHLEVHLAIKV